MYPIFITQVSELEQILESEICFLFPVLHDFNLHRKQNTISFLYGFTISSKSEFLVGNGHYDLPKFELDIGRIRTSLSHICYNKKYLRYHENLLDADLIFWLNNGIPLPTISNPCINFFKRHEKTSSDIPIYSLIEEIREVRNSVLETPYDESVGRFYNNFINQLIKVEDAGLYTRTSGFDNVSKDDLEGVVFTEYNPYTLTGRPSNKFGGVNYAALNKSDGTRSKYVSRHPGGYLLETDYQAFHINLISKLLKYKFDGDPYRILAREFFHTNSPSIEQISLSKELTFQQVYGGVRSEFKNVEFFKRLSLYIHNMEADFLNKSIKSILFKKHIESTDSIVKTFNHLLQNFETEINSLVLTRLNRVLCNKKTKLILYTYDSFLFDIHPEENCDVLPQIQSAISSIGIKFRMKKGYNYNDMIYADIGDVIY